MEHGLCEDEASHSFSSSGSSFSTFFFMLLIRLAECCFIRTNIWSNHLTVVSDGLLELHTCPAQKTFRIKAPVGKIPGDLMVVR